MGRKYGREEWAGSMGVWHVEKTQSALGVVTHTMGGNNVLECWDLWAKLMAYGANTQSNIGFV